MHRPEILAPGGSFAAAFHAIEAGADGVYLGLREFSARKAAVNFDLDQLRRIRGLAADRGRRIYVALNTVVRDDETGRLAETLAMLEALRVDGVIVQDLGAAAIARRFFPGLELHASTQMAVHNAAGLAEIRRMGIRRAILARELTLEEIAALRRACPDVDLEVFAHGALCYSFSGACLASWALTGRSGNRGECAQICRGRFTREGEAGGDVPAAGTFFSCRDLFLGRDALELARIGVRALKIEGRMKSPEYAAAAVRLYRAVIDRGDALDDAEYERLVRAARTAFSREPTTGWLRSSSGTRLVDTRFPGHRGASLGTVASPMRGPGRDGSWIRFTLETDLSLRDGLAFMSDDGAEQHAFSVQEIRQGSRDARFARAGETVEVRLPPDVPLPGPGTEIRHLSSRFQDLPAPREGSVAPYRAPITIEVVLTGTPGGGATLCLATHRPVEARSEDAVTLESAARSRPFAGIVGPLLAESGDSLFSADATMLDNRTGLAADRIFVPPSELKRAKNRFYARLDEAFRASAAERAEAAGRGPEGSGRAAACLASESLAVLADRTAMSPTDRGPLPFARLGDDGTIDAGSLAVRAGFSVVPLPPVMINTSPWVAALQALLEASPEVRFAIGLNNVSHLAVAEALSGLGNAWFFADVFLYTANRWTAALLAERVPRLLFAYRWIEGEQGEADWTGGAAVPVVAVAPGFRAPLFTSRGCFAKHVLNGGACFDGCPKDFRVPLRQGRRRLEVIVADCITYLFDAGVVS